MTVRRPYNALFLCTGNSARSILAEVLLQAEGGDRFRSDSAGSHPTGRINPFGLQLLQKSHLPSEDLRSKSWDEFTVPGAPRLDFIFTVCDNAAGEVCPVWPGQPITAHWGVPDPGAVEGSDEDKRRAIAKASRALLNRIRALVDLPLEKLDRPSLQRRLNELGRSAADAHVV